ncbi:MAG: CTP synthase [Candidatus Micrarchaeia archaeon]
MKQNTEKTKYVFVTGGVLSSLGKGIFASSLARLLKAGGANASIMKIDPYLNCDAGTLNPFEHGEVFVTRDGFECDLDLGNYERFLGIYAKKEQNIMMGSVYKAIIEKERHGDYLGKTLQLIPHATNEIKERIKKAAQATAADLLVIEIGGTVGDIESEIVLEAVRQMRCDLPREDTLSIHLALLPTIITGEQKTKPLQHSVKALLSRGIMPDLIVARCDSPLSQHAIEKISLQCNVRPEDVFSSPTVKNIYELPTLLKKQGLHKNVARKLDIALKEPDLSSWNAATKNLEAAPLVRVAVVGKYAATKDAYMSIFEAIAHAAAANEVRAQTELVNSEENNARSLDGFDAVIVPGGFGARGIEGKITAVKHCRENKIPLLGICYGFQMQVIEAARNILGWSDANTTEASQETTHPVIDLLPEQKSISDKGATMRLGAREVRLKPGTLAYHIYGSDNILKRFRHRYEMNPEYIKALENAGIVFSGSDARGRIMKVLELPGHPFFFGTQFHPEFDSRPDEPEPAFLALLEAAKKRVNK